MYMIFFPFRKKEKRKQIQRPYYCSKQKIGGEVVVVLLHIEIASSCVTNECFRLLLTQEDSKRRFLFQRVLSLCRWGFTCIFDGMEAGSVSSDTCVIENMSSSEGMKDGNEAPEHGLEKSLQFNEEVEEPKVGMTFSSEQEVFNYYTSFAHQKGFDVYKRTSKIEEDGKKYFTLACARAGKSVSNRRRLSNPYVLTKTQCKARLNACLCLDGLIRISSLVLEHNHELCPSKACYFRCNRKSKPQRKRKPELSNQAGITADENIQSVVVEAEGYGNLKLGEKDCGNFIRKASNLRLGTGDAEAIQNYFARMQKQNSKFFYVMDLDDDCRLRNVFWSDSRSTAAYEYFGDVVMLDTTYLTNKYNMPLALFLGVNHHGQSVLLGCALLSNGDVETLIWLFQTWLACMSGHAPSAIVTDEDKALKIATEIVFPKAHHRWCLWHLMKKVTEKLKDYPHYESIKTDLQDAVYDSVSKDDFTASWKKIIESYSLHDNEWLNSLYNERHRWVPVYVKDTFWAGMSTTSRSESMRAFFDGYVNSKTSLKQFLKQFDNAMRDKVEKECLADFSSFNTLVPCVSHFGVEYQFQKVFTNAKFKEFQREVACMMYCNASFERKEGLVSTYSIVESKKVQEAMKYISFNVYYNEEGFEVQCGCRLFEFKGIICRHILSLLKLIRKTESVPSKYVFSRWRKDLKRRHTLVKSSYGDLIANPEAERLDKMCKAFHEVVCTGVNTDFDFMKVMKWIQDLKVVLSSKETSSGRTSTLPIVSNISTISKDDTVTVCQERMG